ncbi:MAG: hypothetical protein IPO85_05170 [Saprospiraceae bacterium]|uniref:Dockerin domain-containing protein n=1 Tax=Candidatus Defluviibacterium haderslevense TaxID=2981993 RepID=A0A9D7S729_9BACT|nr:hypothetical protein [Candidatus Defluviibacterium haderslevense]
MKFLLNSSGSLKPANAAAEFNSAPPHFVNTKFGYLKFLILFLLLMYNNNSFAQNCDPVSIEGECLFRSCAFGVVNHTFDVLIFQNYSQFYQPCFEEPAPVTMEMGPCLTEIYEGDIDAHLYLPNNIQVTPYTDNDYTDYDNGVTSSDLVAIYKHYSNIEEITDPYKIVSADPSGDQDIDVDDYDEVSDLILYHTLFTRPSWEWYNEYDVEHSGGDFEAHPFNYGIAEQWPGGIIYSNVSYSVISNPLYNYRYFNYQTTKIGDVTASSSNSWVCGMYCIKNPTSTSIRTTKDISTFIPSGSTITLHCVLHADGTIAGLEIPIFIDHNVFNILDISQEGSIPLSYHYHESKNYLSTLWVNRTGEEATISEGEKILKLKLLSLKDISDINKYIHFDNRRQVEAVPMFGEPIETNTSIELESVEIGTFNCKYISANNSLLISSPDECNAEYKIYDATGRLIYSENLRLFAGSHEYYINSLPSKQLSILKLCSQFGDKSFKLIL